MLLWLKFAPQPLDFHEEDAEEWTNILSRVICANANDLTPYIQTLQQHSHYARCYQKSVLKCKFPHLPSEKSIVITPLSTTPTNKDHCESLVKNWKQQLSENPETSTMSWNDWLSYIGVDADAYYNTIACSLHRPKFLAARLLKFRTPSTFRRHGISTHCSLRSSENRTTKFRVQSRQ